LPIFPLVIILLQHVLFCPLWSLMGDTLLSDTLRMIAKLVLFVGLCNFLELQSFWLALGCSWGLCLLEAFQ
jgi:hypothetical protein